ncbi:MAG: hypothetical protein KAR64_04245, partial [Thermoplasmatales archaeon]|nr:hypothetical protein [Thermoplasmatales archaeon]
ARITTLTQKLEENENKIKQFDEYQQRFEELDNIHNQLEEEVHSLKEKINEKDSTIDSLQKDLVKAKEYEKYAEYKDKFSETSEQYEKEKERLTKLYHLYEETETECNKLRKETKDWQSWFNSNKEIFDKLFSASPPVSTINTKTREKPKEIFPTAQTTNHATNHTVKTNNTDNQPKPKKRRLRFKK